MIENIVGKMRKCWLPAFSHFPAMFSKVPLPEGFQKSVYCGEELSR